VAVVAFGLVPVLVVNATPALADGIQVSDSLLSDTTTPIFGTQVQNVVGGGSTTWSASNSVKLVRATNGTQLNQANTNQWTTAQVKMLPAATYEGTVAVTFTFAPSSSTTSTQNGQYAMLWWGSDGTYSNARYWQIRCGPAGLGTAPHKRVNNVDTQLKAPISVNPTCGATHRFEVQFSGGSYVLLIDDVVADSFTEAVTWSPTFGYSSGFGVYDAVGVSASGLKATDFAARVGPLPGDIPLPDYRCGRTIRSVGGGQYFVDLEAFNMFPVNVGVGGGDFVGYSDSGFSWLSSWGSSIGAQFPGYDGEVVTSGQPAKVTLALPPLSTMPPGGWTARFSFDRIADNNGSGSWADLGGGDWKEFDADGPGPEPVKPWWVKNVVWEAYMALPPAMRSGTVITPSGVTYTGNSGHHYAPTGILATRVGTTDAGGPIGSGWDSVTAACTVTIDPLNPENGAGGSTGTGTATTSTTVPGATTSTTKPVGTNSTQGEDGSKNDCSAGFLGRVPIIGGVFDSVARLVCALKQLLLELFVPDDLGELLDVGEFSTKFPGSWVSSGVGGVSSLQSTVQAGVNGSACGPVMNVPAPVSMTVRFPGPAGCGGSGNATADSAAFGLFGYREGFRALLTGMLYLGVVWRLIRLAPWSEGRDDGGPVV
jgi:hypothetical protein